MSVANLSWLMGLEARNSYTLFENIKSFMSSMPWIYENKLDAIRQWRIILCFLANMKYNISKKVGENQEQYRKYY